MSDLENLRLFSTHPHPCSYLEGKKAKTLFIDPEADISKSQHSHLSRMGFRRSGPHYYRPFCDACQACTSCRVIVSEFSTSRRYRRVLRQNEDVSISEVTDISSQAYYDMYENYIAQRHKDGDMYPPSQDQFDSFLQDASETTHFHEMRVKDRLIGLFVSDQLDDGLSAVYTFFDPDESGRSPGTLAVLWQIFRARELGLPFVYLGYWVKDCRKMAYKVQYRPVELLLDGSWKRMD